MHRRNFLGALAVGLGATALPVWLSRSFRITDERCDEPFEPQDPAPPPACDRQAGTAAKAQLVLVIPEGDNVSHAHDRGQAFGEILNHGSDEQLGLFALFDVVCRRVRDLPADVRTAVAGDPLMIVLDPHAAVPVLPLSAALPQHPEWRDVHGTPETFEAREQQSILDRMAVIAGLLESAARTLDAQATREQAALSCAEAALFADLPDAVDRLSPAHVDRAAAMTVLAARGADEDTRARLWALLAAAARIRLCDRPIVGAPWARGGGCGVSIEGDDSRGGMACGMGHVPAQSRRFLMFYTSRW